ncbi:multifunctional NAD(FAD)-dependent oxidoreductase/hodanese domain-/SirA-like redox domain/Peroxiredoxin domain-containing protein [Planococcus antarcticus DSM 14505]|uniref:Peroxiredoxin n=1 Tax=Planococcus antarcticus DSM 14505 TaxID=1185653 RepID=A0A1C7DFY5_9BACL|nr:CoA-disulfide reductase [Planococcus antarcticus]ANU10328.1 peroxiredoxin [Planococcus antarcticus DSM 14505]EIM06901.1 multifunctional NAD(FAD)-dependent oxidoreductase/hodanese domain-/SirA-like redox domain/Peroxiredoxin domain-containing protein [Planococcus antarcticus DSM 14505]
MKKIVIVGAVGGGATAAGQIRFYDPEARIVVFDRDSTMSYAACGTPYVIGDVIEDERSIIMTDPEQFKKKRDIDVHLRHEVLEIDRAAKKVRVRNLETSEQFEEPYDALILAPGGSAIVPKVEGLDSSKVFTLRNFDDMQQIDQFIKDERPKNCVVSGGGFIGLEMAENLKNLGLDVSLVHKSPTIMSILDTDISVIIEKELSQHGVKLITGTTIEKTEGKTIKLQNGIELQSDFIIMSIGLRPNTGLAVKAGLKIGETGGIQTNEFMQTNDPSIYAIGDASENFDMVTGDPKRVPLASPAHRQAFVAARHLTGDKIAKKGLLGTSVLKIFSLTAAMTGLNEKAIQDKNLAFATVTHTGNSNAGYYPEHAKLTLKVHYDPQTRKILGAQCIGGKGVDKRIDVIVTAIYGGLTIDDLQALELCYAPPYSSPKDPINMVGYKAITK